MCAAKRSGKTLVMFSMITLVVIALVLPGLAQAQSYTQADEDKFAHLLVAVDGTINVNRAGWDSFDSYSPAFPGTPLRSRDYLQVSGSSRAMILCADLTLTEQFADGVVDCNPDAYDPAFTYADNVDWAVEEVTVFTQDTSEVPAEADGVATQPLDGNQAALVTSGQATIAGLGLEPEAQAYAIANLLANYGLYYDAINTLLNAEGLQCVQRPFVNLDVTDNVIGMFESPEVYIRLGEWYTLSGGATASARFLQCAFELSDQLGDTASAALAATRLAQFATDAGEKITWFQTAIDRYAQLTAGASVDKLIEACGSANCTRPG